MSRFTSALAALVVSSSLLTACGGAEGGDAEACEHLEEGPSVAVTTTPTAEAAPAISDDHQRYDLTLVEVAGGKGGNVTYASAEAGDYVLFLDADVPLAVRDANGGTIQIEESTASSATCEVIKGRHVVELGVGTFTFEFGPTEATQVGVVLEHVAHAHEE